MSSWRAVTATLILFTLGDEAGERYFEAEAWFPGGSA